MVIQVAIRWDCPRRTGDVLYARLTTDSPVPKVRGLFSFKKNNPSHLVREKG